MNDILCKLVDGDVGIVIMLAPDGFLGERDSLLGAVLQTAETLDAVGAELGLAACEPYVALGAEPYALTAADAAFGNVEFLRLGLGELRPDLALKGIQPHLWRSLFAYFARKHRVGYLFGLPLAALLRHGGSDGR